MFAALLGIVIFFSVRATNTLIQHEVTLNVASQQRSTIYLLAVLALRFVHVEDTERESISLLIQDPVANFDRVQAALRFGDEELGIPAIENADILLVLQDTDTNWASYRDLLTDLLLDNPTQDEGELRLESLTAQSTLVYIYADRVVRALEVLSSFEQQAVQRLYGVISIIAAAGLLFTIFVVRRSLRAMRQLEAAAQAFAASDFSQRADTQTVTEIAQIGETFNNMAIQIESLVADLENGIREAEEARARAERSDQVKSSFLASMSHELRTPLNSVINYSKFLAKGVMGPVNERQTETLNKVIDSGKHLLNLINDVLDMSKIESGALNLFVEEGVDLNEIVRAAISTTEPLLEGKPVALQQDLDPQLPPLKGDRQRLRQLLLNVISNACKFTEEGSIKISTDHVNHELLVTVKDSGPGIADEDADAVFEAFKQTRTGLRQGSGTGLGMPISRSLAEAHGGRLWFESEIGKGTTFFIAIPVNSEKLVPTLA
jgi:signal transduction histidine kinase